MTGGGSDKLPKNSEMSHSAKDLIKNFCNYTTTHGVGRLAEAKTVFSRFIWTIFILGAFAMFFYQTRGLFELYLSRPVSTVVKVKHNAKVLFPAVIICNQNPVREDQIPDDYFTSIYKEIREKLSESDFQKRFEEDPPAKSNDTTLPAVGVPPARSDNTTLPEEDPTAESGTTTLPEEDPTAESGTTTLPEEDPTAESGTTTLPEEDPTTESGTTTLPEEDPTTESGTTTLPEEDPKAESGTTTLPEEDPTAKSGATTLPEEDPTAETGTTTLPEEDPTAESGTILPREVRSARSSDTESQEEDSSAKSGDRNLLDIDPEKQLEVEYLVQEMLVAKLAVENYTTLRSMGHQFEDFVFDCNFKGNDCRNYSKYWSHFWDYRYGNCYEFNGGRDDDFNDQQILQTHSTGPFGGLKLNLFIDSLQYVPELSHSAGARVVIRDQNGVSFPDEEGMNALPGVSTSIGVRREVIIREDPFNNGSCRKSNDDERKTLPYTREGCMRTCLGEAQIAKCGCANAQYAFEMKKKHVCDITDDDTTGKCLDNVAIDYQEGYLDCQTGCPVPCSEVVFKTSMSLAEWPTAGYKETLFARLQKRPNNAYDDYVEEGADFLDKEFLQVRVYFERLNYQEVKEQLSYKELNLLADIGGQLGLWIGISVLTCCEFLELLLLLGKTVMKRITPNGNIVKVQAL